MFEEGMKFKYVSNIHSFCYVDADPNITGLFTAEERNEIMDFKEKNVKPFVADGMFHRFYKKFSHCETTDELRRVLYSKHEELQPEQKGEGRILALPVIFYFFAKHVRTGFLRLLACFQPLIKWKSLLQDGRIDCFREDLSETWLLANRYAALQFLFNDTKNIFYLGGEKSGIAVADRKNSRRAVPGLKEMSKKSIGKKGDGYVRLFSGTTKDLAATEAGQKWTGNNGTKSLIETVAKLPKVLRDILVSNHSRAKGSEKTLRSMAVPGLAIYGPKVRSLLLDAPKGYVTRCSVTDWDEMTMSISKAAILANLRVFAKFLTMRMHVLENERLIGNANLNCESGDEDDPVLSLLEEFAGTARKKVPRPALALPSTHPTPKKRRTILYC
ncbi:hypothetical protein HK104_005077 [Borealophlyctis nickersoniae]|nr:hypothetical protein HK104_005077 [Borealophlyctis nickersoniae]